MKDRKITMADIGERGFLKSISHLIDDTILGFGDDASAYLLPSGDVLVINVDMLVKTTDILSGTSPKQIGKKAVTISVSDIIAKGVYPLGCLASVAFPSHMEIIEAKEIIEGIKEQSTLYNSLYLGGDLNSSIDTIIDITTFGITSQEKIIKRKSIENGDLLYTTGYFGYTTLCFKKFLKKTEITSCLTKSILDSVYEPKARIEYLELMNSTPIKACIDSSDGLQTSLNDLMGLNGVGVNISTVPIDPLILSIANEEQLDPLELTFCGGEEFELLLVTSPENGQIVEKKAKQYGLPLYPIGTFNEEKEKISIIDPLFQERKIPSSSYEHFKN